MPQLLIERHTQPGRCRSCGAAIEWATTPGGARMPFNPPVVLVAALYADADYVEVDRTQTVSHFATCPDAAAWRRRRAPGGRP